MEKKQVIEFMDRIKSHYQEFVIDDFKIKEWYEELKQYGFEDVNKKLDEHLRSEQYGNSIPKVYFLTKYLTKEKDKGTKTYIISCSNCGKHISSNEIDKHYERCNSVGFLITNSKKYLNKNLNRQKLMEVDEKTFKDYYYKVCSEIMPLIDDNSMKRKCIENILSRHYTGENKYTMKEILS